MSGFGLVVDPGERSFSASQSKIEPSLPAEQGLSQAASLSRSCSKRSNEEKVEDESKQWHVAASHAVDVAQYVLSQHPRSPIAYARLAQAFAQLGKSDEAVDSASKALSLSEEAGADEAGSIGTVYACLRLLMDLGEKQLAGQHLAYLPSTSSLNLLAAEILVQDRKFNEALERLGEASEDARVSALRGYIYLLADQPQMALRELKRAISLASSEHASMYKNIAICYWRLGSAKKAISSARIALRASPGRRDISLMLLDFLIDTGRKEEALSEVSKLRASGVIETSDLVIFEARLAAMDGKHERVRSLLSRARNLAEVEGDRLRVAETSANLSVMEHIKRGGNRAVLARDLNQRLQEHPESSAIFRMLADQTRRVSEVDLLEKALAIFRQHSDDQATVAMGESMVANLRGEFTAAAERAIEWSALDPSDPQAAAVALMLEGQTTENWDITAERARHAVRTLVNTEGLVNSAAYALALGGDARSALRLLRSYGPDTYVLRATYGLSLIAAGEVSDGLAQYRRAADLADKHPLASSARPLMTIHQCAALRRLGFVGDSLPLELVAASLPAVDLPADWSDDPSFVIMKWVADKNGWDWPLMIA